MFVLESAKTLAPPEGSTRGETGGGIPQNRNRATGSARSGRRLALGPGVLRRTPPCPHAMVSEMNWSEVKNQYHEAYVRFIRGQILVRAGILLSLLSY